MAISDALVNITWLGRVEYQAAWDRQRVERDKLIQAKRATPPRTEPHSILGVEHPPVYTLGKNADKSNLLADGTALDAIGANAVEIDRGGDITFHGPGQLVVYPILDLERIFTDLGRYLRSLEEAVIQTLGEYGVPAGRVAGRTGVWVGPDEYGPERKICAMGIHCSRWVTTHGLALNVTTDLDYFSHIIPCGIADRGVTSLLAELELRGSTRVPDLALIFHQLAEQIANRLSLAPTSTEVPPPQVNARHDERLRP